MQELAQEYAVFEEMRTELESKHMGKIIVIKGEKVVGTYDNMEDAARAAVQCFGRGPYLIKEIGEPEVVLPSMVYGVGR